jgi:hypothetical protein
MLEELKEKRARKSDINKVNLCEAASKKAVI